MVKVHAGLSPTATLRGKMSGFLEAALHQSATAIQCHVFQHKSCRCLPADCPEASDALARRDWPDSARTIASMPIAECVDLAPSPLRCVEDSRSENLSFCLRNQVDLSHYGYVGKAQHRADLARKVHATGRLKHYDSEASVSVRRAPQG